MAQGAGQSDGAPVEVSLTAAPPNHRYRDMVEGAGDIIYTLDREGRITSLNSAFERITGWSRDDWLGRDFRPLIHPEDLPLSLHCFQEHLQGRKLPPHGLRIHCKSGEFKEIEFNGGSLFDGDEVVGVMGLARDITERKRAEELERERNHLRNAVAAMEHVLGVVGHELRTPLAGLRAMSEFLLTDVEHHNDETIVFLNNIHDEVIRLSETVNELLEAARLNSGRAKWNWSVFSLEKICEEAMEGVRPLVDHGRVSLSWEVDPPRATMRGDADAIRRLLLNLLNNSRKHTRHGTIRVAVGVVAAPEQQWIELQVRDTGEGIAPEIVERLGEAFALNSGVVGANYIHGTGLGLAICEGIVAAHGGTMKIESTLGEGTTILLRVRGDLTGPVKTRTAIRFAAAPPPAGA